MNAHRNYLKRFEAMRDQLLAHGHPAADAERWAREFADKGRTKILSEELDYPEAALWNGDAP